MLIAAAIALGIGIWALKDPLQDLTGPVGDLVGTINDYAAVPFAVLDGGIGPGGFASLKEIGDDDRWFS